MRIIFSRKGFDSSAGRFPSAILPDGTLISFPIPDRHRAQLRQYEDLRPRGHDLAKLLQDLMGTAYDKLGPVHLDPDLDHQTMPRLKGWRGAFGQCSSAQKHLSNQGVTRGDLFLFFGLFRHVERVDGWWRFVGQR